MLPFDDIKFNYAKYKWEFLRRNKNYRDNWEELHKQIDETETIGKWRNQDTGTPHDEDGAQMWDAIKKFAFFAAQGDAVESFCNKWKILFAVNPSHSVEDLTQTIIMAAKEGLYITIPDSLKEYAESLLIKIFMPCFLRRPAYVIHDGLLGTDDWDFLHEQEFLPPSLLGEGLLKVTVDLNYSKKRIMEELEKFVSNYKEIYERHQNVLIAEPFKNEVLERNLEMGDFNTEQSLDENTWKWIEFSNEDLVKIDKNCKRIKGRLRPSKKYHFENFPAYLKVYDLRESGMSWSKIVLEVSLNSISAARNHYNAACNIIGQGVEFYIK